MNKNYKFGILINTFNRFEYAEKMLKSFSNTIFIPNTIVHVTDDCSTEEDLISFLEKYNINNKLITLNKFKNSVNIGSKNNYKNSILSFEDKDVDFIINLDSDCILNKNWLVKINELINNFNENIICSSFCCKYHNGNPSNYLKNISEDYYERETLNGLGVCFPKKLIDDFKIYTNKHFDEYLCKELKNKHNMTCICTSMSYIQHIGVYGVHSNPYTCDISDNFLGE